MPVRAVVFVACITALGACESTTEAKPSYSASMTGAKERPNPVTTTATGAFSATIDGSILSYTVSFTGLTSNSTGAHIHGPATTEAATGVLVNFDAASAGRTITLGTTSGSGSGTVDLAATSVITATVSGDSLRKLLDLGLLYVNIHSANNPGGEIRGQIARQ